MKYVSTRGNAPKLGFLDAVLAGLANDGGLYVPEQIPEFSADEIKSMAGMEYTDSVSYTHLTLPTTPYV